MAIAVNGTGVLGRILASGSAGRCIRRVGPADLVAVWRQLACQAGLRIQQYIFGRSVILTHPAIGTQTANRHKGTDNY